MSYKIEKNKDKTEFIVKYNHVQGLLIQDGAELVEGTYTEFTYALLPNEIMFQEEVEIEVDVPDYETKIEEYEEPIFNEFDEVIGYETKTQEVEVYVGSHKEMQPILINYPIINPNYEEEQKQKEKEKIAMLKLTRGDVFRGLLQAKGITRAYIRDVIEQLPDETTEEKFIKEMALIDFEEALDFYRGNQLINTIGFQLGITETQLNNFFKYNDYQCLIEPDEPVEEITDGE